MSDAPARPTPPWYFLVLDLPFGAAVGFLSYAVPLWMSLRGYGLAEVATVTATANLPHAVKLFWIPVLDLGSVRRLWYLGMSGVVALLFLSLALVPDPFADMRLFAVWLAVLQAAATTAHAANNALMASTTRFEDKGKVGGFAMASNVGSTGLLGALAILLGQASGVQAAAVAMAVVTLGSAALGWRVVEPRFVDDAVARAGSLARATLLHLWAMAKDLGRTVASREGFTGLIICLAPVGCMAMSNLFSGIAGDYQASPNVVALANGIGGGVASALGALVGGVLADRMSRRVAYAASGGLTALSAVAMALAPLTPWTYTWGTFTYLFAGGIAFATWAGMVLEMVGSSAATATKYALFNATANLAISYVTWLNGQGGEWGKKTFGLAEARGALLTDAALTVAGVLVLVAMVLLVPPRPPAPAASSA